MSAAGWAAQGWGLCHGCKWGAVAFSRTFSWGIPGPPLCSPPRSHLWFEVSGSLRAGRHHCPLGASGQPYVSLRDRPRPPTGPRTAAVAPSSPSARRVLPASSWKRGWGRGFAEPGAVPTELQHLGARPWGVHAGGQWRGAAGTVGSAVPGRLCQAVVHHPDGAARSAQTRLAGCRLQLGASRAGWRQPTCLKAGSSFTLCPGATKYKRKLETR